MKPQICEGSALVIESAAGLENDVGIVSLLLVQFALEALALWPNVPWPQGNLVCLIFLCASVILGFAFSRQLPAQNVLLAAGLISGMGGGFEALTAYGRFPFARLAVGVPLWVMPLV